MIKTKLIQQLPAIMLLAVFAGAGCTSTESENVTTQGINADIDVIADGSGSTVVRAQLEVGSGGIGGTQLELSPGDTLTAMANGIQQTMVKDSSLFGDIEYFANFGFDDADTLFVVALNRTNGMSAPNSNVVLPDGFIVLSPLSSTVYALDQNVSIVWAPSGTGLTPDVSVSVTCTLLSGLSTFMFRPLLITNDSGSASIPVSSVMPVGTLDTTRLCEAEVNLSRYRNGSLDPNYGEGGQITAEQHQTSPFFIDPAT